MPPAAAAGSRRHGVDREIPKPFDEKLKDRKYIGQTGMDLIEKAKSLGNHPQANEIKDTANISFHCRPNPIPFPTTF